MRDPAKPSRDEGNDDGFTPQGRTDRPLTWIGGQPESLMATCGSGKGERLLDVVVVGAGPCGLATAVAAKEHGLRYAILDRACVTASLARYPCHMTFFSSVERLEIGGVPFTIPEPKPTRREALAYYRHVVRHHGLEIRQYEEVTEVTREPGLRGTPSFFRVRTQARGPGAVSASGPRSLNGDGAQDSGRLHEPGRAAELVARAVVIATGGFGDPNRLKLSGEPDGYPDKIIHYYQEPYPYFDQDVLVVGGGNSAVETALDLYRNGARVRMVHFGYNFDRGVKPWVRPDIDNRLASGEILMQWGSRVAGVGPGTVTIVEEETGTATEAANDWIFAMTGWRPDHTLLERLGVESHPETGVPARDPTTMETTVPGVYIAGVIAAGFDANKIFIENGREHGARIAAHLAGQIRSDR